MPSKLSKETFIERSQNVHGQVYDYSAVDYTTCGTKVKIICGYHGEFNQNPDSHMRGHGCPKCAAANRTTPLVEFIGQALKVHGDKWDYGQVIYQSSKKKVAIRCGEHGVFQQTPHNHLLGHGCPKCSRSIKVTTEYIVGKFQEKHGDLYDYSLFTYSGYKKKSIFLCPRHGVFATTPAVHLNGKGCVQCRAKPPGDFIKKAIEVHGDTYDYHLVLDAPHRTVKISCRKHGIFEQRKDHHLSGRGCPKCYKSKGERGIELFLKNHGISFEAEKKFRGCVNPKTGKELKFDFFVPCRKLCIEFDGVFHFTEPWGTQSTWGGNRDISDVIVDTQYRDSIKDRFIENSDLSLLRISYKDMPQLETILSEKLGLYDE
jgi:hypothetical protein